MAESVNRYFRIISGQRRSTPSGRLWCPAADVYQTQDGWVVKVELAGVAPEDLDIRVSGRVMLITGCRRDTMTSECLSWQQLEITYSRFEKSLEFPCVIEDFTITTKFWHGLLVIRLRA